MPSIVSKIPTIGTSIFSVMSALAQKHEAINLGQGFPDFPMDEKIIDRVNEAMKDGMNQYAPMQGYLPLREVISQKIKSLYNTSVDPEQQITITPGGTYAIYNALTTILNEGDEVILFEPAYDSYIPNILSNKAIPVPIALKAPNFSIDWNEVKSKINNKTRAIIINTPHNPTATILNEEDLIQLKSIVIQSNIFIISDEVYEHLIYDGKNHQSILRYPDLLERSFVCFSFGKLFHCTGWKIGYCVSSPELMKEFRKLHQFNCFSCHTPSQVAIAEILQNSESYISLPSFMQEKRDRFVRLMQGTRFTLLPSFGTYFMCATYENLSEAEDLDFAKSMTIHNGVATIPLSAFYSQPTTQKVIRFCFAKKEETLQAAVQKLVKL